MSKVIQPTNDQWKLSIVYLTSHQTLTSLRLPSGVGCLIIAVLSEKELHLSAVDCWPYLSRLFLWEEKEKSGLEFKI